MSLLTNWGYTLTDANELADFITAEEFQNFTAGKFNGDVRIAPNIKAAGTAIRNYCGWHVYPANECELKATFYDNRVAFVEGGILIQLPARYVSDVTSVTIAGADYPHFVLETNGVLRVFGGFSGVKMYSEIDVVYTAGLPDGLMDPIKELVAQRVIHALSSSYGVTSEAAGGVSITYNASWAGNTQATALTDPGREVLTPYRLEGVF